MEKKIEIYRTKHKILMDKVDNNLILIREIAGEFRLNEVQVTVSDQEYGEWNFVPSRLRYLS